MIVHDGCSSRMCQFYPVDSIVSKSFSGPITSWTDRNKGSRRMCPTDPLIVWLGYGLKTSLAQEIRYNHNPMVYLFFLIT